MILRFHALPCAHHPLQQAQLQVGHGAVELGGEGAHLLTALQEVKQGSVQVQRLCCSGTQTLKVNDITAKESDLEIKATVRKIISLQLSNRQTLFFSCALK